MAVARGIFCQLDGTDRWSDNGQGGWHCRACVNYRFRQRHLALREEAIRAYGSHCVCCGETEPRFLTLDHIHGSGSAHKREIGRNNFLSYLKQQGWPKDGIQLLCWNCNCGRALNGGVCPKHGVDFPDILNPEQQIHLFNIQQDFVSRLARRYRTGVEAHGGMLWEKPKILPMLLDELIDGHVYGVTADEQAEFPELIDPEARDIDE